MNKSAPHSPLFGHSQGIQELIDCGRLFHSRGWSVGTSSNYSVVLNQDPVDLIVTASGHDKGRLEESNFVRIGPNGLPTHAGQPKSSAETMLHVALANRPEKIGAILHTHSVWGTLLSQHFFDFRGFEISDYEMLKGFEGITTHSTNIWVPIFDNTQDIPALSREIQEFHEKSPEKIRFGFLIRHHGLYTWGPSIFAARRHIEIFEFLFECIGRRLGF